jgi:hypothetical protein
MSAHVAGASSLPLGHNVVSAATFGGLGNCYRYHLKRRWRAEGAPVLFVMMNPSTADLARDDRTVAKCTKFAKSWGYPALMVGNIHAYRCTDQARLAETADPCGPENDTHLLAMAALSDLIVMAYGTPKIPSLRARGPAVAAMLRDAGHSLTVLRLSTAGVPWHPLYIADDTLPTPWAPAA